MMQRGDKEALLRRLRRDARVIADHFDLEYRGIYSERANVRSRYGACFSDGRITIRLWNLRTGRPLAYSTLVDTLCHELAHLRHFNHGRQFKRLYAEILGWAKAHGIYRPRRSQVTGAPGAQSAGAPPPRSARRLPVPPPADTSVAPWERWAAALGVPVAPQPAPAPRRARVLVPPAPVRKGVGIPVPEPTQARSAQLSLLDAPPRPQRAPRRTAPKKAPPAPRRACQLPLFA